MVTARGWQGFDALQGGWRPLGLIVYTVSQTAAVRQPGLGTGKLQLLWALAGSVAGAGLHGWMAGRRQGLAAP